MPKNSDDSASNTTRWRSSLRFPITVLRDRKVPSPDHPSVHALDPDWACGISLSEALGSTWGSDAHCTAYAPVEINGCVVRLARGALRPENLEDLGAVRMRALIGDIDGPNHKATRKWRAETEPKLRATELHWYRTRGGYRIISPLPGDFEIENEGDARLWTELHDGWREWLRAEHGLVLDHRCSDWTRLYRLPNVSRDGAEQESLVHGRGKVFDADAHWHTPAPRKKREKTQPEEAKAQPVSRELERARALAERLSPSVEGHDGDTCLMICAREIATILGEDADAIENVLRDVFNPRCLPPWDASKLRLEAVRAAARQATPIDRAIRRREEERRAPRADSAQAHDLGVEHSFLAPPVELDYLCPGLGLATSQGKISLLAGEAGGGKGPIADHLAICFATGAKAFGAHECRQAKVMLLDSEGVLLTMDRLRRIAAAMRVDVRDLEGNLRVIDASTRTITDESYLLELEHIIVSSGIEVLVLDSYTSAMLESGADFNSPEFASLAKRLGQLGILVIAVAHANKAYSARGGDPRLTDIAGSAALAAMAQTAIVVSYPDQSVRTRIRIACARAPENPFKAFEIYTKDGSNRELTLATIEGTRAMAHTDPTQTRSSRGRKGKTEAEKLEAASRDATRIVRFLATGQDRSVTARCVRDHLGVGAEAAGRALEEAVRREDILHHRIGNRRMYELTDRGRARAAEVVHASPVPPPAHPVAPSD